jgi:hypothetical protein
MVASTVPNPTTKTPGVSGSSTAATSPNVGAGYKLPTNAVVNSYGQTVLNPKIGSALAPLASTIVPPAPRGPGCNSLPCDRWIRTRATAAYGYDTER